MSRGTIAVVAALGWECRSVVRALTGVERTRVDEYRIWRGRGAGVEVSVIQAGVGPQRAERAAALLLEHERFDACLSVGCAGALREGLAAGALVIADEIVEEERRYATDVELRGGLARAAAAIDPASTGGAFLCCTVPLMTVAAKRDAERRTGAIVVEMEGAGVARAAAAAGVPFAAARAVLDSVEHDLPGGDDFVDPADGVLRWPALLRAVATRPQLAPQLMALRRHAAEAGDSLEKLFRAYLSALVVEGGRVCS